MLEELSGFSPQEIVNKSSLDYFADYHQEKIAAAIESAFKSRNLCAWCQVTVMSKIFDISAGFTRPGTDDEKSSGFGMILCKEFVDKNNGNIKIESEWGKGTIISIELPAKSPN